MSMQNVSLFSLPATTTTTPSAWSFTIQDLVTTLDRLYRICDISENAKPCHEVIQQLRRSLQEFESLKERLESPKVQQHQSTPTNHPHTTLHQRNANVNITPSVGKSPNPLTSAPGTAMTTVSSPSRPPVVQNCWVNGNPLTGNSTPLSPSSLPHSSTYGSNSSTPLTSTHGGSGTIQDHNHDRKLSIREGNKASSNTNTPQGKSSLPVNSTKKNISKSQIQNVNKFQMGPDSEKSAWGTDRSLVASPQGRRVTRQYSNTSSPFTPANTSTDDFYINVQDDLEMEDISLVSNISPFLSIEEEEEEKDVSMNNSSWCDISDSPSPQRQDADFVRDRLTSPTRGKASHQSLLERQEKAKLNREQQQKLRREEARKSTERVRAAMQRREEKQLLLLKATEEKHKRAEENARLYVELISENARSENQKVDEWKLYNQMKHEALIEKTVSKLSSSESRRKKQIQSMIEKLKKDKVREKEAKEKRDKLFEQKQKYLIEKETTRKAAEARREVIEKKEQENISQKNAEKFAKVQETNKKQQILQEQKMKLYLEKLENSEKRKSEQLQTIKQKAYSVNERVKEVKSRKGNVNDSEIQDESLQKQRKASSLKKVKRLKEKLQQAKEYFDSQLSENPSDQDDSKINPSLKRVLQDLKQQIQSKRHATVTSLIHDLIRYLDRKPEEVDSLRSEGIFEILIQLIQKNDQKFPVTVASKLLSRICSTPENVTHLVTTFQIIPVIETLHESLIEGRVDLIPHLLSVLIAVIRSTHIPNHSQMERECIGDLISLFVAMDGIQEILQLISRFILNSQFGLSGTIPPMIHKAAYLLQCISEFMLLVLDRDDVPVYESNNVEHELGSDTVISVLSETLSELMSLMAHLLLKQGPSRGDSFQQSISPSILNFCLAIFKFFNHFANIDLGLFQKLMCDTEVFSCKHVIAFLLEHCSRDMDLRPGSIPDSDDPSYTSTKADIEMRLLNEVVLFTGYFALDNHENQKILQNTSGKGNIIQLLCHLPIIYFADEAFKSVLIPSLIAVTYRSEDNTNILSQEMGLETLIQSQEAILPNQQYEDNGGVKTNLRKAFLPQNRVYTSQDVIDFYQRFISE